jgi:hypothetical protein
MAAEIKKQDLVVNFIIYHNNLIPDQYHRATVQQNKSGKALSRYNLPRLFLNAS